MDLSPAWEYVADTVMGGVSRGRLTYAVVAGRPAARLQGAVSLENNGGFIQCAFDLRPDGGAFDASAFAGIEVEVWGNDHAYDLRLRTDQLTRPWQSFRAGFVAVPRWTTVRLPFAGFESHRTEARFDPARLRRVGVLAIGEAFEANVAIAGVRLFSA
jgi:hypothetical protein